jgi:glycosyltransferase involved in cell wall biosynthesis
MHTSISGISVVVCTYNGRSKLEPTLLSIASQKFDDADWELIIVDNNSTDGSTLFAKSFLQQIEFKKSYQLLNESKQGKNYAALLGLRNARFEYILICDDDNHLDQNYLQTAFHILRSSPKIGVLGGCGNALFEQTPPEWFNRYYHSYAIGPQHRQNGMIDKSKAALYGAGTFFYKPGLERYFNHSFEGIMECRTATKLTSGGDTEWCWLLQLAGYEIWYSDALRFGHFMPAERLQWDYYLKLKEGIASGTGLLLSYEPFFKKEKPGTAYFIANYISSFFSYFTRWLFFQIRKLIQPSHYSNEIRQLGNVILTETIISLLSDFFKSFRHFQKLRRVYASFN